MSYASVLIVSDDTDFARMVAARWQAQRRIPEITLTTSDVWQAASADGYNLVIVGPVQKGKISAILSALSSNTSSAVICVCDDAREVSTLSAQYPCVLAMPRKEGWIGTLILVSGEALRRTDAVARAQRAERMGIESQRDATLGRYMLEMRPGLNNALTSVLGNADLLMLDPGQLSAEGRHQVQAIHAMALRINEVMQRFSSLAAEMRANKKESQTDVVDTFERA